LLPHFVLVFSCVFITVELLNNAIKELLYVKFKLVTLLLLESAGIDFTVESLYTELFHVILFYGIYRVVQKKLHKV